MLYVINKAIEVYGSEDWEKIRCNAKDSRFDWSSSAKEYISVYKNLLKW
jgi:glycogen synthase